MRIARLTFAATLLGVGAGGVVNPAGSWAGPAGEEVEARPGRDGTIEFSNQRRRSRARSGRARRARSSAKRSHRNAGAFWFREREDGVMEFTNLHPIGRRWKVLFKTGPGKAGALRGKTDRVPARDTSPERFTRYDEHIRHQQAFYGIPPALVRAVIKTESDFDPNVVSSVGAQGLMQLMPGTAQSMGVTDPFDPRQRIMGGSRYLQLMARRFCHTPAPPGAWRSTAFYCSPEEQMKVIAAYHAGPGAVAKYGGMPPYQTTRTYVATVLMRFERYRALETPAALAEGSR